MRINLIPLIWVALSGVVQADAPKVVTSVAPVFNLLSDVMEGVGTPGLLMPANADPHHFAMGPRQVRQLNEADLVVGIGQGLEPWLKQSVDQGIWLAERPEVATKALPLRDFHNGVFVALDVVDPHMWLDPEIVGIWAGLIAAELSLLDTENAAVYHENARDIQAQLAEASLHLIDAAKGTDQRDLVLAHDGFQYLERLLNTKAVGAFSTGDGEHIGARSQSMLAGIAEPVCVLEDAAHPDGAVFNHMQDAVIVQIDSLGAEPIADFFLHITAAIASCGGLSVHPGD